MFRLRLFVLALVALSVGAFGLAEPTTIFTSTGDELDAVLVSSAAVLAVGLLWFGGRAVYRMTRVSVGEASV